MPDKTHNVTRDEHSKLENRLQKTETQISSLAKSVDILRQSIHESHIEMKDGFKTLHDRLDINQEKLSSQGRLDWAVITAMGTLMVMVVGSLGGFMYLNTQPVKELAASNQVLLMERLKQLPDDYELFGRNTSVIMDNASEINRIQEDLHELFKESSEHHAQIQSLSSEIKAIDQYGSRKWIKGAN